MEQKNKIRLLLVDKSELIIAEEISEMERDMVAAYGQIVREHFIWLKAPALVYHERAVGGSLGFMLTPWLPNELLSDLVIELDTKKIMGYLVPSPALLSLYQAWSKIEQEKLHEFSKDFDIQVASIESYIKDRFAHTKEHHQKKIVTANTTHISNAIYNLFESETNWGDPNVTH